jgi:hypothetical protein
MMNLCVHVCTIKWFVLFEHHLLLAYRIRDELVLRVYEGLNLVHQNVSQLLYETICMYVCVCVCRCVCM